MSEKGDESTVQKTAQETAAQESRPAGKRKKRGLMTALGVAIFSLCLLLSLALSAVSLVQGWLLARQVAALQARIVTPAGESRETPPLRRPGQPSSPPVTGEQPIVVQATDVVVSDERLDVALLVYRNGPADLLFETPVLVDGRGGEYRPVADSLEQAHYDLLDLVTGGQAQTSLQFPRPDSTTGLRLIFNTGRTAGDPVAPRIVVPLDAG